MTFQSLYRKHRPQRFGDLVGQEHVTTALRNAVREERVGHAYLFSGPRGTGKTTSARLLAKALNCLALGDDGEPCGTCENCVAVAAGTFGDLVELDAASNRGVNEARDLVSRIMLGLGASSRRKVYILDEVHMLTTEASNTLLKTLEEPPDHVVFVLATTDPQKVLPTIRSRTQHFEFSLLTTGQLVGHLRTVLAAEGVDADDAALEAIAHAAAGSARDALSLLDQALALGTGQLDADLVAAAFGTTPVDTRLAILDALAGENLAGALGGIADLLTDGHDPRRVAEDLLRALRDAFMAVNASGRVPMELPGDEADRLRAIGTALGNTTLVRALETLGQAVVDMRGTDAADPRLVLEVALVRIARREAGPPLQALADRVERLEQALEAGGGHATGSVPPGSGSDPATAGPKLALGGVRTAPAAPSPPPPAPRPAPRAATTATAVVELDLDDVIVAWAAVLPTLSVATRNMVQEAQPIAVERDVVTFGVPARVMEAAKPRFQRDADTIRAALAQRLGTTPKFTLVAHDGFTGGRVATADDVALAGAPPGEIDLREPGDAEPAIDPTELVDAPLADTDPVARLAESLGATVVEEHPREQE